MMKRSVLLAALLAASTAWGQAYRWVDEKGKVHYGDAPPTGTKSVQKSATPRSEAPKPAEPFALQQARTANPVKLYTSPDCPQGCTEARDYLNKRGIPFTEISVTDSAKLEELKQASGGNGVPVMIVGKSVQKGFEAGMYETALDSAGYPRMGILPARSASAPAEPPAAAPDKPAAKADEPSRPRGPYAPR